MEPLAAAILARALRRPCDWAER